MTDRQFVAETTLETVKQSRDQAHASSERAARDTTKLLSTLHAGVAITSVAWLRRVFERSYVPPFTDLAHALNYAIALNMIGLLLVGAAALVDTMTPGYLVESYKLVHGVLLDAMKPGAPPGLDSPEMLGAAKLEAKYHRWNAVSHWLGRISLALLAVAFGVITYGAHSTLGGVSVGSLWRAK